MLLDNSTRVFNSSTIGTPMCWLFQQTGDTIPEDDEMFYLEVRAENGLDTILGSNTFDLTITDDDGMLYYINSVSPLKLWGGKDKQVP